MSNKAIKIMESLQKAAGSEVYESVINACGILEEDASVAKQSQYTVKVLKNLEDTYGTDLAEKVMKPCGSHCISDATIMKAKALYQRSENINEFVSLLNEQHIGGGNLHFEGKKLIGIYNKCYCGIAKQGRGLTSCYCNCSTGWFGRLFSEVLGRAVEVNKLKTILDGSKQCVFEINIV